MPAIRQAQQARAPAPTETIPIHPLDVRVQTEQMLEQQYGTDVDELCADHEQLIEQILEEEE